MMWTGFDILIALVILAAILGIITLIVRALYPNKVVADERDEFDNYVSENPETRFRKVNGDDV
jgi:hypothetical protein